MKEDSNGELMVTIRCLVYNHELYIRQCLEGFVMQKTSFRFEAIVHDDASTDGTAAIIREYAERYPDIIKPIFETENQYSKHDGSIKRIMNEHTHGKYVAMCEGDDYWIDPLKLQKQVDFMETHIDYTMCFHNAIVLNQVSSKWEKIKSFNYFSEDKEVTVAEIINDWYIPTASIIYRNSARRDTPSFFSGDYVLSLMLVSVGKVHYMNQYMSVYRLNTGGISVNVKTSKWADQMFELLDWYNKYSGGIHQKLIQRRKKGIKRFERYCLLKKKCFILPFIFMPHYTFQRIKNKLYNIY